MKSKTMLLFLVNFILFTGKIQANPDLPKPNTLFNHLESIEKLNIEIKTDLDRILDGKYIDESQAAEISVYSGKKMLSTWDAKIKLRGRFRRLNCDFPPLKLDLDKDELKERGYAKFDKFKLVTHCLNDRINSTENIARELLAYQIYNIISPYSYRAILVKVTYIDSAKGKKSKIVRQGILIEPTSELENRINATEMEDLINPSTTSLNADLENKVALFQYMIGNEDWSLKMARNVKFFESKADGKLITVPYDFDFSGLVNARYAIPNSNLNLTSIQERVFMGIPTDPRIYKINRKFLELKKEAIYNAIRTAPKLSGEGKTYAKAYIESFYDELEHLIVPFYSATSDKPANDIEEK